MAKPFKETKFGKFLKEKVPGILDVVDDFFPPAKLLTSLISKDPSIPPQVKAEALEKLREYELTEYKEHLADVQNARSREVEITKATGKRDVVLMVLAFFGVAAPVGIVIYLMAYGMPDLDKEIAMLVGGLIGMIVGEYKTIFGYFFGSSAGSKEKNNMIKEMSNGNK